MIHLTIHEDSSSIKYKSLVAFLHNEKIVFEQSPVLPQTDVMRGQSPEPACGGDCGMSYCDEYGCIDAKPAGVEPCPPPEAGA